MKVVGSRRQNYLSYATHATPEKYTADDARPATRNPGAHDVKEYPSRTPPQTRRYSRAWNTWPLLPSYFGTLWC